MGREAWKAIPIEDCDGYEVSDRGRVRSLLNSRGNPRPVPKILAVRVERGYARVAIRRRKYRVHRLVLLAFVGPCPVGMEARHLHGKSDRNMLASLEWSDHSTNLRDQKIHGRRRPASPKKHLAKVPIVHRMRAEGASAAKIAKALDMPESTARNIYMGRRHKYFIPMAG